MESTPSRRPGSVARDHELVDYWVDFEERKGVLIAAMRLVATRLARTETAALWPVEPGDSVWGHWGCEDASVAELVAVLKAVGLEDAESWLADSDGLQVPARPVA